MSRFTLKHLMVVGTFAAALSLSTPAMAACAKLTWICWEDKDGIPTLGYFKLDANKFQQEKFDFFIKDKKWDYTDNIHTIGRTELSDLPFEDSVEENNLSIEDAFSKLGVRQTSWTWQISEDEYYAARKAHIGLKIPPKSAQA